MCVRLRHRSSCSFSPLKPLCCFCESQTLCKISSALLFYFMLVFCLFCFPSFQCRRVNHLAEVGLELVILLPWSLSSLYHKAQLGFLYYLFLLFTHLLFVLLTVCLCVTYISVLAVFVSELCFTILIPLPTSSLKL